MKPYYEAYDERYRTIHAMGHRWAGDVPTPIVMETIQKYEVDPAEPMLEIGCGEGRDALPLLKQGMNLLATDVSPEAIEFCRKQDPRFADRFQVLDCLRSGETRRFGFLFSVAVLHMLLLDADRSGFYRFVREHLTDDGVALICSMGDGEREMMTDPGDAFRLLEREHPSGRVRVAGTSLRMVSFPRFERELAGGGLQILEKGFTSCPPEFDRLMYAVVKRA